MNDKLPDLNNLADACYVNAARKGFYDTKSRIDELIHNAVIRGEMNQTAGERLLAEFSSIWGLSRIALVMTELAEAAEAVRKPNLMSDHIPGMQLLDEELADVVIRVADLAGSRSTLLGDCVEAKMAYNAGRPFMHGKLS